METLLEVNWVLIARVIIIEFVLLIVALIDAIRNETKGPKIAWILLIVFIGIIGPVVYFIFGRKK